MREGEKALRDKVEPYLSRDISKIEVGPLRNFKQSNHIYLIFRYLFLIVLK